MMYCTIHGYFQNTTANDGCPQYKMLIGGISRPITDFEVKLIQGLKNRHYSAAVHVRDLKSLDMYDASNTEAEHVKQEEEKYQFLVDEIQKIFDEAAKT